MMLKKFFAIAITLLGYGAYSSAYAAEFRDVPSSSAFSEAITYVQQKGLVNGYSDGTFQPNQSINRFDFTKIIVQARIPANEIAGCKSQQASFPDVASGQWYTPFVCVAKINAIINGYGDGTFRGLDNVSFPEAAKIILEAYNINVPATSGAWYESYVQTAKEMGITKGVRTDINSKITRGEMAILIYNIEQRLASPGAMSLPPSISVPVPQPDFPVNEPQKTVGDIPSLNIYQSLARMPEASSMYSAVKLSKTGGVLSATGPFTLLIPSNDAFADLSDAVLSSLLNSENSSLLQNIMNMHIFSGEYSIRDFTDGQLLKTVSGASVTVSISDGEAYIGNAKIIQADLRASNGVIHIIDQVYLKD